MLPSDFPPPTDSSDDDDEQDYFIVMLEQLASEARRLGETEVAIHLEAAAMARREALAKRNRS